MSDEKLPPNWREGFDLHMAHLHHGEPHTHRDCPMLIDVLAEFERLRAASKAAFACIECDGEVTADEDGCCSNCGSDCFVLIGLPAEREILRHDISARFEAEVERLRARNEALVALVSKFSAFTCSGYLMGDNGRLVDAGEMARLGSAALSALAEPGNGGAT